MSTGIPVKLLNEAQGHVVTLELNNGDTYRGKLIDSEDNMNVSLREIILTKKTGQVEHMDHCFIRGSNVRFFSIPEILSNAPMLNTNFVRPPAPIRGRGGPRR